MRADVEQFSFPHPTDARPLTISVATPGDASVGPAPVIYLVDGDLIFGMAAEIARALRNVGALPPCYVVGIGYNAGYDDVLKRRTADMTPPLSPEGLKVVMAMGGLGQRIGAERNGGAAAFMTFMADELIPQVEARYPVAGGKRSFFGHSLGGLFAAHMLLARPELFHSVTISSPSLWWNGFAVLDGLAGFAKRLSGLARHPRALVDIGGREQDPPTSAPPGVAIETAREWVEMMREVDAAKEFADALRDAGLARVRHIVFEGEDHYSVVPRALVHGLRFALTDLEG